MSQRVLYQIAAVALVVGAVLAATGNLLAPQGGARAAVDSWTYYPSAFAVLLGGLLVMASFPAVYLRQRGESGVLGFAGLVAVLAAGLPLTVGFTTVQILIYPWIATMSVSDKVLNDGPTAFNIFFAVASFLIWLGGVLFGVATIRARVFSRKLGIGLIVLASASELHQRLAAVGQYVTYTPGPSPTVSVEHELQRWLAVNPRADAAAGFRAGWSRPASLPAPKLREWEARWFGAMRENVASKRELGLLREISRLGDDALRRTLDDRNAARDVTGNSCPT